jgi:hypothetical protein
MIKKLQGKKMLTATIVFLMICLSSVSISTSTALLEFDINNDGIINTLDLIEMSNHIGMTGTPGWISDDVDHNGIIQICDLMLVATHYGETTISPMGDSFFVSTSGRDTNSGTLSNPFATLSKAISASSSGDTIYMRGGTYTNSITISKSGITIRNYNNEKPIIVGTTSTTVQFSSGISNVLFYGINFSNSPGDCVFLTKSNSHITFSHCGFYNIPRHVVYGYNENGAPTSYIDYLNINNCTTSKVGWESGYMGEVFSLGGCRNFVYENNMLRNFNKQGLCNGAGSCNGLIQGNTFVNTKYFSYKIDPSWAYNDYTVHDIIIRNNLFTGTGTTDKREIFINPEVGYGGRCRVYNIEIYNNIFDTTASSGGISHAISVGANSVGSIFSNIRITFNTFYVTSGSSNFAMTIKKGDDTFTNCVIANNIFVTTSTATQISTDTTSGFTFKNNCFYYPSGTAQGISDGVGLGTGGIRANPLFVNAGNDFRLTTSSPCRDAASSTYTVSESYDGISRPQGSGYDIGAYEYH